MKLMDIHFILWVIIQFYVILLLQLFLLWPLGALSSSVSLTYPVILFSEHCFTFWKQTILLNLVHFLP